MKMAIIGQFLKISSLIAIISFSLTLKVEALSESDIQIEQNQHDIQLQAHNPDDHNLIWQYAYNIEADDCQTGLQANLNSINSANNYQATVTVPDQNQSLIYCFKITNASQNQTIWRSYQYTYTAEPTTIQITLNARILSVEARGQAADAESWYYDKFDYQPQCQEVFLPKRLPSDNLKIVVSEADINHWFCFQVTNNNQQIIHADYFLQNLDIRPPVINFRQLNRTLIADAPEDEQLRNWQYTFSQTDIECDDKTFLNNQSVVRHQNRVVLTANHQGYTYCFRVQDQANNWGYGKYKVVEINFSPPNIKLEQTGLKLQISTDDVNIPTWHYLKTEDSICNRQTDFSQGISIDQIPSLNNLNKKYEQTLSLTEGDHNFYYCVRAINSIQTQGFANLKIDAKAPTINLQLQDSTLTAKTNEDNVRFSYIKSQEDIVCNQSSQAKFQKSNIDYHINSRIELFDQDNGYWICFRAEDQVQNVAWAKQKIENITRIASESSDKQGNNQDIIAVIIVLILLGVGYAVWKAKFSTNKEHVDQSSRHQVKLPNKESEDDKDKINPTDYL
ncbi:MAG: hypothetical protein OXF49_01230 [Candidatus Saccharibacteria bacterium]|nr:hypothetical protein [Candidatus Saccharibacteria bacterium]